MPNLQQLRNRLEEGFYLDNLYKMAQLCKSLALDTTSPMPFFVMEQIFSGIARRWEEVPLQVEEAKRVELKIIPALKELVQGLEARVPIEEISGLLNKAVVGYLTSFI